ncbi:MAG: thioesterase [Anaerolineales bacterium]|jgi:acyl-CoA thioester hydrolase
MTKHTTPFTVRHYECDAYGHLNNAVYLQYMQESAINASTACGLDRAAYQRLGHVWIIRASEIEYLQALRAGEEINVHTWIAGFRRSISRREYELRRSVDGSVAARGSSDWVYLDAKNLRPALISPEIQEALSGGSAPEQNDGRIRLDDPHAPPSAPFKIERRVEWRDIDEMQHLNNAAYLSYAEGCAMQLSEAYGWPFQRWVAAGVAFVARRNRVEYLQPAYLHDRLIIRTWLFDVRRASATRHYEFLRAADGELLARLQTDWVLINLNTGRPTRFPPDFEERLADNIAT